MEERIELVATCLFGLEKFLGEEIESLGYERVETTDGRIVFRGPLSAIARANIFLRFAEKVYIKMGSFEAGSFEEARKLRSDALFEWVKSVAALGQPFGSSYVDSANNKHNVPSKYENLVNQFDIAVVIPVKNEFPTFINKVSQISFSKRKSIIINQKLK